MVLEIVRAFHLSPEPSMIPNGKNIPVRITIVIRPDRTSNQRRADSRFM